VCFDADDTGIIECKTKKQLNIIPLYLPRNENIKGYDIARLFKNIPKIFRE
jgi:hypothetical protein